MPGLVSLTGSDVVQINGTILTALADGNPVELTFPNDLVNVKASKNGNILYAFNNMGAITECKLRLLVGSSDDKMMNSLLASESTNFSSLILSTGYFVKRVGDGQGNIANVVYQMSGGLVKKNPEAKTAAEGDTDQSVVEYIIIFGNSTRAVQ